MDSSSNYPRKPFDPFGVMLFKALQVVAFLFFLALLVMNPEAKPGKIDTKAEVIITMNWPDSHPDDIDLYVGDPLGNVAWWKEREQGFMTLERDDRGGLNNSLNVNGRQVYSPVREEIVSIRGIVAGEYVANVQYYLATQHQPVPVSVKVEKINPTADIVDYTTLTLTKQGQEKTAVRFTMAPDGSISGINHTEKSLVELVRSRRRGADSGEK